MEKEIITVIYVLALRNVCAGDHSLSRGINTSLSQSTVYNTNTCELILWNASKSYFQSRLIALKPNFVHFNLKFNVSPMPYEPEAFRPYSWVWTYSSPTASYPYLSWNIDHGLLSFGLLDVKTYAIPYILINVSSSCNLTLGTYETDMEIVKTFEGVLKDMTDSSYHKYEKSFFCYLEESPGVRNTFEYTAALYFNYPIAFINYRCCELEYYYQNSGYNQSCPQGQVKKWATCTLGPYILGLVIFMYFPILVFTTAAWLADREVIKSYGTELKEGYENIDEKDGKNWIYLDGKQPITLFHCLGFIVQPCLRHHPVALSRLRRLFCVAVTPAVIFLQIKMYEGGIGVDDSKISVQELVAYRTPMGFLSLLGEREDRNKVFVPVFGGAMCILIMYYVLGVVFLVFPKSLKQIVELGLPMRRQFTPLCLSATDIIELSMVNTSPEPGYETAASVCKCSILMLFGKPFWLRVFEIQKRRISLTGINPSRTAFVAKLIFSPLYLVLCVVEIIVCFVFYAVPLFGLVSIMVRGAVKSILMLRLQNRVISALFGNPLTILLGTITICTMFLFYFYSVGLIFIQSFSFISQIIIFCFVAVIVYPSVSFGYLFFFVVLLYYLVRLISDFGEGYLELLQVAVEKSRELYSQINNVVIQDGQILSYNIAPYRLKGIKINDMPVNIPQNVWQQISQDVRHRVKAFGNMYGIPKPLFYHLVQKYRPVHVQVLKIIFHLSVIICLVAMTLSITTKIATGANSEISDVMHVIFIVTVGALPRVLEVALMTSSETVRREIEMRSIEQSIIGYWIEKTNDGSSTEI